jgi:hypothetical protein
MFLWGPSICCKIQEIFVWEFGQNCTEVHKIAEKAQWVNVSLDCIIIIQT